MSEVDKKPTAGPEVFKTEAEAERQLQQMLSESRDRLGNRCPECGALGSLEDVAGKLRCIDCDVEVAATTKISGFGRR
jgi:hypothetical protein